MKRGSMAARFDSTYEGLKHYMFLVRDRIEDSFDSTYEGLKQGFPLAGGGMAEVSTVPMRA